MMKNSSKSVNLIKKTSEMVENESKSVENAQVVIVNREGRPTKYNAGRIEQLHEYTERCSGVSRLPTLEGYAWFIGTCADTITNWTKKHKKFFRAIKRFKDMQSSLLQEGVVTGGMNPAGAIFLLKNNHKFKDKHEVEHTAEGDRIDGITYTRPEGAKDGTTTSEAND